MSPVKYTGKHMPVIINQIKKPWFRGEPPTITLLNGHCSKLPSKSVFVCADIRTAFVALSLYQRNLIEQWREINTEIHN